MNPLLRELGPIDLEAVRAIHRRLEARLERIRGTIEELTERRRLLDAWAELQEPPEELARGRVPWSLEREQLLSEREAIRRFLEEERRSSVLLREAGRSLDSFLDLATAGMEEEATATPAGPPAVQNAGSNMAVAPASEPVTAVELGPPTLEWRSLARECLDARGPLHYREIYRHLRSRSVVFGGAHPPGTFLATFNRDSGFVRVGRGVYWLADRPLPASESGAPEAPAGSDGGHR